MRNHYIATFENHLNRAVLSTTFTALLYSAKSDRAAKMYATRHLPVVSACCTITLYKKAPCGRLLKVAVQTYYGWQAENPDMTMDNLY